MPNRMDCARSGFKNEAMQCFVPLLLLCMNGFIKHLLDKVTADQPENWHRYLQPILFAIRGISNEFTGLSPFEVLYGANPRGIMDIYKELLIDKNTFKSTKDAYTYTCDTSERLLTACQYVRQALEKSCHKQRFYANQKAKLRRLKHGDLVLIFLPENNNMLKASWKGPYKLLAARTNVDCLIDLNKHKKVFNINMFKKV